jgi:AcrR family transcriptional regulator
MSADDRMPATRSRPDRTWASVQRLPRGRHGLPRTFVVQNQRDRIFESIGVVCADKGYSGVTVEDITAQAGVSRRTFYDLFADKEQCFLGAFDLIVTRLFAEVKSAYLAGAHGWPERIAAGLRALTHDLAAEPELARLAMVEVLAAGQKGLERRDAALQAFAAFFYPGGALLPAGMASHELLAQAVVGGLYEALYANIVQGETASLPEVLPDLLYCALVPYVGHTRAIRASEAERRQGHGA